jgi:hypothetical protein
MIARLLDPEHAELETVNVPPVMSSTGSVPSGLRGQGDGPF